MDRQHDIQHGSFDFNPQTLFALRLHPGEQDRRWLTVGSAALFAALQALLATNRSRTAEYVGLAQHLSMFPVVAALPAPRWARAMGYGWLVIDTAVGGAALNGLDEDQVFSIRLGGHVLMGSWITASSLTVGGLPTLAGVPLGLGTAGYSLVARWVDRRVLYALGPVMILWLLLLASRRKAR